MFDESHLVDLAARSVFAVLVSVWVSEMTDIVWEPKECPGRPYHSIYQQNSCKWCDAKRSYVTRKKKEFVMGPKDEIHLNRISHRQYVLKILRLRYGSVCWYCGLSLVNEIQHIDHIVPKSKGGVNEFDNFALSCGYCNRAKMDRDVDEFIDWIRRFKNNELPYHDFYRPSWAANGPRIDYHAKP